MGSATVTRSTISGTQFTTGCLSLGTRAKDENMGGSITVRVRIIVWPGSLGAGMGSNDGHAHRAARASAARGAREGGDPLLEFAPTRRGLEGGREFLGEQVGLHGTIDEANATQPVTHEPFAVLHVGPGDEDRRQLSAPWHVTDQGCGREGLRSRNARVQNDDPDVAGLDVAERLGRRRCRDEAGAERAEREPG